MEIQYKTQYAVTHNGKTQRFDDADEAWAVTRETLLAAYNEVTASNFDGSVSWETEVDQVPATPFDELLNEYMHNPHGNDGGIDDLDRERPFLRVEENIHGGYWLASGTDPDALADHHFNQEYAEEWELIGIFDTRTGEQVHGTSAVTY